MMKKLVSMLVLIVLPMSLLVAEDAGKTINYFTKENTSWHSIAYVKSRKGGVVYPTAGKPGYIWFKSTPGEKKDHYNWMSKQFPVGECDKLLLEYKAMPGTALVVDVYWDTSPKRQRRVVRKVPGDGKWHKTVIPVRGKAIRICCGPNNSVDAKESQERKVFIGPLYAVSDKAKAKVNSSWLKYPLIIPEPKQLQDSGKTIELAENGKVKFGICLNSGNIDFKKIVVREIAGYCGIDPGKVRTAENGSKLADSPIIISLEIGKNGSRKEGYTIQFLKEKNRNKIILRANDKTGLYWALQTFRQLLRKKNGKVVVSACDIKDWPDYMYRGLFAGNNEQAGRNLELKVGIIHTAAWWFNNLFRKPESRRYKKYMEYLERLCAYVVPRGGWIGNNLCVHFQKGSITVSDDKEIDWLFGLYNVTLKRGGNVALLAIDDGGRKKESFTAADRKAYNNDILLSHAWFMKKMTEKIWANYPEAIIVGTTKDYESSAGVAGYYDRIGVSKKLIMIWTGPQCVTFDYTKSAIAKYEKGIEGRPFIIADNTPGQAHGMYRGLTICEPYGEPRARDGYKLLYGTNCVGVKANFSPDNQVRLIRCMSIAEYMWNASRYNPEKARQRAIAKVAGNPLAVEPILKYAGLYLKLAYKFPIDKRIPSKKRRDFIVEKGQRQVAGLKALEDKELSRYSIGSGEYKKIQGQIKQMDELLKKIVKTCRNPKLTAEFTVYQKNMIEIIDYLHRNNKPLPVIDPHGKYVFNMNDVPGGRGYTNRGNGKISCAIYGKQTPYCFLEAVFRMEKLPAGKTVMTIEGRNCDKHIADMKIELNGHRIFSGKTPFVVKGWKTKSFTVPAGYFRKGKNVIKILNTSQSSDFIDHWVVISEIAFNTELQSKSH